MINSVNFQSDVVQLLIDNENIDDEGLKEALAAVVKNPYITWTKFTLTDDEPNMNKQRVPLDEFTNLISSGVHMPIKMAYSEISDGHDGTFPIGVITHLKKFKNTIVGLAALWSSERPEDIGIIKDKFNKKEPLNLSWELAYSSSKEDENSGVTDLLGVNLKAATLVGIPAYAGRTQIQAVASKNEKGDKTLEELEKIQKELADSLVENTELKDKVANLETAASTINTELEELRAFKSDIVAEQERADKLEAIKTKFSEAGIVKEDTYFEEKGSILLGLDEASLEFFIQEAVSFASKEEKEEEAEAGVTKIPSFVAEKPEKVNIKELAKSLRES